MQVVGRKIRPSRVYLLSLVVVVFIIGALAWEIWTSQYTEDFKYHSGNEEEMSQILSAQAELLATRNLELSIERAANNNMQEMFAKQQQKEKELRRELAFYRSIMTPEHQVEGVAIHDFEMIPSLLNNRYRVQLILTQLQKRKQGLKGRAELTFIGLKQGEITHIPLSSLVDDKFNFSFRYFQVLSAELTLPEDFELSQVDVKVTVSTSRASAEQSFSAQELLDLQDLQNSPEAEMPLEEAIPLEETIVEDIDETKITEESRLLLEQNSQVSDNPAQ